ncbi:YceI family protein [Flavobacterium sp. F-65]|uniref:YceI family protein n=1 Tax=Flavobacterium pisciphilum TaxID=2893755 RepID=A0ABS8MRU5_9FLAO|nr:YceI family protein [Flavobacterium sp. F-65]MCC9071481.1 YceI family protein [Flavobacterium sp. F-65]
MKKSTFLFLLLTVNFIVAQDKMRTSIGVINFEASVPFFEEVNAVNKAVIMVMEPGTSSFVCVAVMRDFRFKMDLMETHFNENYIESDRYPKAIFKGKIGKFDMKDINEIPKAYTIKGKLQIHGKTKEIEVSALLKKVAGGIEIISDFPLNTDDFNIKIPSMIESKISKRVNTSLEGVMK